VPIGVVGAEEQYVSVGTSAKLARILGTPDFPIVPQWFIPGGQLPLPTKYRIHFGEPLRFEGDPDDDDAAIEERVAVVRSAVEGLLARGLSERTSIFR